MELLCLLFLPISLILMRLIFSPYISLYKKEKWYIKLRIFFFSPRCKYCGQIAVRNKYPGDINYCLNDYCHSRADRESWNPFGSASNPLPTLGWKLNKESKQ